MKRKFLLTGSITAGIMSIAVTLVTRAQDPAPAPSETAPRSSTRPDQQQNAPGANQQQSDTSSGASTSSQNTPDASPGPGAQPTTGQSTANAQLDPQAKQVIDEMNQRGARPFEGLSAEDARKEPTIADAVKRVMKNQNKEKTEVGDTDDVTIKLSDAELDGRIYKPKGDGPFPVIVYYHGGGWVLGDLDTYDSSARSLCKATDALVISADYRKAPEHKFPTAQNDAYGAYQWAMHNAGRWGGDAKRVAVVGESAGGTLAAAVSIMAQDQGIQMPVHEALIYPVADTKMDTPSYKEQANAQPLSAAKMKWFFDQTFSKAEDRNDPKVALLQAKTLKGLPKTTIITAQFDPLRSEGEALAKKLQADGVQVEYRNFEGLPHEFFGMAPVVDKAQEAVNFVASNLKESFGTNRGQQASDDNHSEIYGGSTGRTGGSTSGGSTGSSGGNAGGTGSSATGGSGAGGTGTSGTSSGGASGR